MNKMMQLHKRELPCLLDRIPMQPISDLNRAANYVVFPQSLGVSSWMDASMKR
jgi:hypothetical protein